MLKFLSLTCLFIFSASRLLAVNENIDSANIYLTKATQLSKASKVWEADKNFQKAIKFSPGNIEIRLAYGNYLINQRKYFIAVEQFGKVLENDITHGVALQKLTEISFLLRRWTDVIAYSNQLMQHSPGNNVKYMLGKAYYELENYGKAKNFLTAELNDNPANADAVTLLGKVLIELSDYKQAIAVYHQSLSLNPNDKQLLYELGMLYYTMNNEKEAVKYFELAAVKGFKQDLGFQENLGLAYLSFDMGKGVDLLNKVLENKPGNVDILFQIAQAYFKFEKYQDAADTYQKIFDNDPSNSRALFMTGVAYQKKGDKNKGVSICEQAIRMDPGLAQHKTSKVIF